MMRNFVRRLAVASSFVVLGAIMLATYTPLQEFARGQGFTLPDLSAISGHASVQGTVPVLTSCGTSPTIVGTDVAGLVTMGTGTPTGCVITFSRTWGVVPFCVVNWQGTPLAAQNWTTTATAITTVQTATSSNLLNYVCLGRVGST